MPSFQQAWDSSGKATQTHGVRCRCSGGAIAIACIAWHSGVFCGVFPVFFGLEKNDGRFSLFFEYA